MPGGLLVTEPAPTLRIVSLARLAKVAVTAVSAFMVKVQVAPRPEQPPDQPVKTDPASAVAVKSTT